MSIIRQIPWTNQPPTGRDIDWSNPLTSGLVAVHTGADISGWTNNNNGLIVPSSQGLARNFVSASSQYLSRSLAVTYPLTMFVLHRQTTLGVNRTLISVGNSSTGRHTLYLGTADQLLLFSGSGGGQWGSSSASVFYQDTSSFHMAVGVVRSATNRQGYYDGTSPFAANTATDTVAASNTVAVGASWLSGAPQAGFYWPGDIALAGVFNRALTDAEILSLSRNPWQLFTPSTQRIWVPVSSSGAYTLTADHGTYAVSGQTANIFKNKLITAGQGNYSITGQAATITHTTAGGYTLVADKGDYTYTGQTATLKRSKLIAANSGTYSIAGQSATVAYSGSNTITLKAGSWIRYRIIT
jgi:hypothetical protein